jgi:hypothetical protein
MFPTKLKIIALLTACAVVTGLCGLAWADEQVQPAENVKGGAVLHGSPAGPPGFQELHHLLRPQRHELPWNKIPWILSITEARAKAAAEGKPLLIVVGGGAGFANVFGQC